MFVCCSFMYQRLQILLVFLYCVLTLCMCVCVYKIFIESLYCTPLSTKPTIIILYRSPICVVIMWWGRGVFYDLMIKIQCFRGSRFQYCDFISIFLLVQCLPCLLLSFLAEKSSKSIFLKTCSPLSMLFSDSFLEAHAGGSWTRDQFSFPSWNKVS